MSDGLIRQAMAYRVKYRMQQADERFIRRIPLSLLGVHKLNRGGVYPQPDTVRNLGIKLLELGFSIGEANHEGVCVQEVPADERGHADLAAVAAPSSQYETYAQFNTRNCVSPILSTCFPPGGDTLFGTLSHSHLLLVLLCFTTGAQWKDMPEKWHRLLNGDGSFNYAAVAASDPELAVLMREGLDMEVLSWKMCVEEPTACSLISQALNTGQQMAFKTTELTALAVLTGAVTRELESAVAGAVAFQTVQDKVRAELDHYVDMPEFVDLFEFVVNMGAGKQSFIPMLLDFGSKFVDQKQRQLRLDAFAAANKLPLEVPRCKIAMIMRAYRKPPTRSWCPTPEAAWARMARHAARERKRKGEREREREREGERERERARGVRERERERESEQDHREMEKRVYR